MRKFFSAIPMLAITLWSNIAGMVQQLFIIKPPDTQQLLSQDRPLIRSENQTDNYRYVDFSQSSQSPEPLRAYTTDSSVFTATGYTGTYVPSPSPAATTNVSIVAEPEIIQPISQVEYNKINSHYFTENKKG